MLVQYPSTISKADKCKHKFTFSSDSQLLPEWKARQKLCNSAEANLLQKHALANFLQKDALVNFFAKTCAGQLKLSGSRWFIQCIVPPSGRITWGTNCYCKEMQLKRDSLTCFSCCCQSLFLCHDLSPRAGYLNPPSKTTHVSRAMRSFPCNALWRCLFSLFSQSWPNNQDLVMFI